MKTLTVAEARAIDRDAVERLGMPSILLMENAAHGVAAAARGLGDRWIVLAGGGNNGGDGLAAARLLGPGARVFLLSEPDPLRASDAALQARILRAAGVPIAVGTLPEDVPEGTVWIDALFGTGLARPLEGAAAAWVGRMNGARGRRLCVDIPSGLHGDTGEVLGCAVRGDVTVTFECAKLGMTRGAGPAHCGRIVVAPLGLPRA
ncbi:MAG: hypothetical protein Fur0037_18090 [Planctomycetota bacterium]